MQVFVIAALPDLCGNQKTGAGDGGNRKQHAESGGFSAFQPEKTAGGDGDARTAGAGNHCQTLGQTDQKRVFVCHIGNAALWRLKTVGDPQQNTEQENVPADDFGAAQPFHAEVVQRQTEDDCRDGADDKHQQQPEVGSRQLV